MKNHIPLRDWASPSYDASTGKSASAFAEPGMAVTIEDMPIRPNGQLPRRDNAAPGTPSLAELDRNRCQGGTPVRSRPIG
jgi:hypothetical protein